MLVDKSNIEETMNTTLLTTFYGAKKIVDIVSGMVCFKGSKIVSACGGGGAFREYNFTFYNIILLAFP